MSAALAERIRAAIGTAPGTGEIRMFGGLCFTLNGNMRIVAGRDGSAFARVGPEAEASALAEPGAERMVMRGRELAGYVMMPADRLTDAGLQRWLALSADFVGALPPKQPRRRKRG